MHDRRDRVLLALGVVLIGLSCFRYETYSANSSGHYIGPVAGAKCTIIICVVLVFKLIRIWADILVDRGRISERPSVRFDWPVLAVIIIPWFHYVVTGEFVTTYTGEPKPSWQFEWGTRQGLDTFALSVVALALLLRVYAVARALLDAKPALKCEADASQRDPVR